MEVLNGIIDQIINPLIVLLLAVALLLFLWGTYKFFILDTEKAREEGKSHMLWGIVGMVLMLSVIGILNLLLNTFGIELPDGVSL